MGVTEQQIESYNLNGWLVVEGVLSTEEVAALSQRSDEIILEEKLIQTHRTGHRRHCRN